ncbi:MAG: hypothetical protein QOE01_345 [Actinomycetota bacterium]|nr:hypothetical protein [Actinomycetota bacterium]
MTGGRPVEAARVAARRIALFHGLPVEPTSALELKDALHMGALAGIGAGDLAAACGYGDRHRSLVFLREQRDLAVEAGLAPDALAGRWRSALAAGAVYLTDWIASGRPTAAGRAIGPAAVAMVHGLCGDDESRDTWLGAVATLRGVDRAQATKGSGYGSVFDAILLLHKGKAVLARAALTEDSDGAATWYRHLMVQWRAALLAEAAVLAADADAEERCADAAVVASGNPLATAITDRACALASHDSGTLVELAGRFDSVGALYQAARTLVLAGGSRAEDGVARLAELTEPG